MSAGTKQYGGPVLFLDRDDINTDEIIPARYLNEVAKQDLKAHLFEDLALEGCDRAAIDKAGAVITRANFGCGSSREHAPWALEVNAIRLVVASGFARIFRQNMFNCGLLPVELPSEAIDDIFTGFNGKAAEAAADIDAGVLTVRAGRVHRTYPFELSGFHRDLIRAGGWVAFAAGRY